jgi:uncharacterized protein (DUF1778 family)
MPLAQTPVQSGRNPDAALSRRTRFYVRVAEEQKALIERAAALTGRSISQYIVSSALRAAERVIREHEVIVLSARDAAAMAENLLHPAPANDALRRAFARRRELIGEE